MRRALGGLFLVTIWLPADSGAGIQWTAPAGWKAEAERPMRLATYTLALGADCVFYFFGTGQGGSVEANLDRWIGPFLQADGKASKAAAKIAKRTIHGWPVTTLDVSGAYTGMGGPMVKAGEPPCQATGCWPPSSKVRKARYSLSVSARRRPLTPTRPPSTRCLRRSNKMPASLGPVR